MIDALEHHQCLETVLTAHFDDLNDNGVTNLGVEYQRLLIRCVGSGPYGARVLFQGQQEDLVLGQYAAFAQRFFLDTINNITAPSL